MEEHPVVRASQEESGGCAIAGVIGLLVLCAVIVILDDGPQTSPSVSEASLEYQLAYIHNAFVGVSPKEPSEWLVLRFRSALDGLEVRCEETRPELSDLGVAAHDDLRQAGKSETLLQLFTLWSTSVPGVASEMPCGEIIAAYLTLRES